MPKKKSKKQKKESYHRKRTSSSSNSKGNNDKMTEGFNTSSKYQHEAQRSSLSKKKREASSPLSKDIVGMDPKRFMEDKASTPLISEPRSAVADTKQKSTWERKHKRGSNSEEFETQRSNKHTYGIVNYTDNNSKEARQELHSSSVQIDTLKGKEKKKNIKLDHDKKQPRCGKAELDEEMMIKHSKMRSCLFSKTLHMSEKWSKNIKIAKKLCDNLQASVNKSCPKPHTSKVPGKNVKQFTEAKNVSNCSLPRMTYALPVSSEKSSSTTACWTQKKYKQEYSKLAGHSEAKSTDFPSNSDVSLKQSSEVPGPSICHQISEDTDQEMQIIEELHAARNERKIGLTVVQSCGELTSMDIELTEEDPTLNPTLPPAIIAAQLNLLIVLDTNILLSHLQFIEKLKSGGIPGIGTFVLIIPWVVLQELDYMKNGKLLEHMKNKAIPAVRFIYNSLKKQDPHLWGQSMQLASEKMYGLSNENNDDRVLQCCLQYQKLYPHSSIILCTDDKNLCSKALISGVKALCKVDLALKLHNLSATYSQINHQTHVTLPHTAKDAEPQKDGKDAAVENFLSSVILDLEKCLGKALSFILETEMKIAFEELWIEVVYLKPPWTLADLLQCFKKHWIAVFGLIVKRDLLETVDSLYENLRKGGPFDYLTAMFLVQKSCTLLHAFSSRSNYDGVLPKAYSELNQLLERILKLENGSLQGSAGAKTFSGNSPCNKIEDTALHLKTNKENKVSNTATSPGSNRAQEIWSVLEHVWNTVSEYSAEVFQKFNYSQTLLPLQSATKLVSVEEAFLCLQKLMTTVKDVLAGIQKILAPNSSYEDAWTLCNFLTTTEINAANIRFTTQELYECLSQREYKEKLTVGCCQLAQLEHAMKHCHASVEVKTKGWM
uniref:Transcriptional protein SWT1 n=1 Tax=Geotrypetes seraphini TaxID=260995 RepID=A0A6P8SBW8_GEOSA|nr:transcriptional protein SWT1 [Geotrypetes seraphini]XP_033815698.1 transcriptional protein SWT1 [Geotrypetes seraphini]